MDWTFGSTSMKAAEKAFTARTGEDVFFGVGTYGTSADIQRGLGSCLRMTIDGVSKDILAQSINTGSDVAGTQFDLQVGDGGAGAFNTCAGEDFSMYPGSYDAWGHVYGGVDTRAECAGLPPYPQIPGPMEAAHDSLIELCQYSFDMKVRLEPPAESNPTILAVARVECPEELVFFTQMKRLDDPTGFQMDDGALVAAPNKVCGDDGTLANCLTRMMDCRKPSGAFKDNVVDKIMKPAYKLVQTCTQDGYTRQDVQCGCTDCYC
jgi:hypothetical protein